MKRISNFAPVKIFVTFLFPVIKVIVISAVATFILSPHKTFLSPYIDGITIQGPSKLDIVPLTEEELKERFRYKKHKCCLANVPMRKAISGQVTNY